MASTKTLSLVALLSAGCIFGGKEGKADNNDANNSTNNTSSNNSTNSTNGTTGDTGVPVEDIGMPADVGVPDFGQPDLPDVETFTRLTGMPESCSVPRTYWFSPPADTTAEIRETSVVASIGPPGEGLLRLPLSDLSVVHATPIGGQVQVYAAAANVDDLGGEVTPVHWAATTIDVDAEVFAISATAGWIARSSAAPGEIFTILVATSAGVFDCVVTLDDNDVTDMSCVPSPFTAELMARSLSEPQRIDPAPVFDAVDNDFLFKFAAPTVIAPVSGLDGGVERLVVVKAEPGVGVATVETPLVQVLRPQESFSERMVFGVEANSFGFPKLLTLARTEVDGELAPRLLKAGTNSGTEYELVETPGWALSQRLTATRGQFTFVERYDDVDMTLFGLAYRFPPGSLDFGYVGIDGGGGGLIFSIPDRFGETDYLQFPLPDSAEIQAFKNIPLAPNSLGTPPIAVIHGSNRDKLAVLVWGFGLTTTWVQDLLGPGFAKAQRMSPTWFWSDGGQISMLAERMGGGAAGPQWVTAIVPVPDVSNLRASCR